jgi:hypothetical protein
MLHSKKHMQAVREQHTAIAARHLQVCCAATPVHAVRDVAAIEDLSKHLQGQGSKYNSSDQNERLYVRWLQHSTPSTLNTHIYAAHNSQPSVLTYRRSSHGICSYASR